jgi:hypothetical protein
VAAGQLELTGGAQPIFFFFPNSLKTSIQLLLKAQQHKKYARTTPLDDGVSSLFQVAFIIFSIFKSSFYEQSQIFLCHCCH